MLTDKEKLELLNPLRYSAALTITVGGVMHGIGLYFLVRDNQAIPWSVWIIFSIAVCGYVASAILILKNNIVGYLSTFLAPLIGGLILLTGFIYPESGFLKFLPGTYDNEIRLIGFITLITEPIAVACSGMLIKNRIWKFKSIV